MPFGFRIASGLRRMALHDESKLTCSGAVLSRVEFSRPRPRPVSELARPSPLSVLLRRRRMPPLPPTSQIAAVAAALGDDVLGCPDSGLVGAGRQAWRLRSAPPRPRRLLKALVHRPIRAGLPIPRCSSSASAKLEGEPALCLYVQLRRLHARLLQRAGRADRSGRLAPAAPTRRPLRVNSA